MLEDTKERLKGWGDWVRSGGVSHGYSSVCLVAPSGRGCDVPDDEALGVDRAVARLKQREPDLGRVLINYYVRRWDYQTIGIEFKMSRERVRVLVRTAEAWVDACLWENNDDKMVSYG